MELYSQVYVPASVVWKGEILRMIDAEESLITNTLDEASVLVMLTELFFHWAAAVLQERTSNWPTVAWWLPLLTSTVPMVTTGRAALQLATKSWQRESLVTGHSTSTCWDTNLVMLITSWQDDIIDTLHYAVTVAMYNTNGGNLVWFGNQEQGTRLPRRNRLARCFSLVLFGD